MFESIDLIILNYRHKLYRMKIRTSYNIPNSNDNLNYTLNAQIIAAPTKHSMMVWNAMTAQFVACFMSTRRQPSAEVYRNGLLINVPPPAPFACSNFHSRSHSR